MQNSLAVDSKHLLSNVVAKNTLKYLAGSWLIVALIGQWLFAIYVLVAFAYPVVTGQANPETTKHMIQGHVSGDAFGNIMLYSHIIPAAIISLSGIFQLLPRVRKRWPRFHKYNGRLFLSLGFLGALSGLYLTWIRGSRLSDLGAMGVTINGILILVAVYFAWKYARERRFAVHEVWATHAFLLINGVWTFRLYLMAWFFVNQGANGNNNTLDGPADIAISFSCYLLPMLFAQLYFWARKQRSSILVWSTNLLLLVAVLITAIGVFSASIMMWLPRIIG